MHSETWQTLRHTQESEQGGTELPGKESIGTFSPEEVYAARGGWGSPELRGGEDRQTQVGGMQGAG